MYSRLAAFFIAANPSEAVSSGVVLNFVNAPLAVTAIAHATALTLSDPSMMMTASYSPKQSHAPASFPPTFLAIFLITSVRSVGDLTKPAMVVGA